MADATTSLYNAGTTPVIQGALTRPGQINQQGDTFALHLAQYAGMVEGTLERRSVMADFVPRRSVRGTSTIRNYAIGETTLGVVEPGVAPRAHGVDFSKAELTIDTVVYARNVTPLLDEFQTEYDARAEIGREHGKKIAKFTDQAFFIQAAKAAQMAESRYRDAASGTSPDGHTGGTQYTFTDVNDAKDPAKVYNALSELETMMSEKDVEWEEDGFVIVLRPKIFKALRDAEQIINGTYVTADGTQKEGMIFKAFGVPVKRSNNLPTGNVTGHFLSNARNGNAYDGDFTKLAGIVVSPRALLAGETIPLETDVWYNKDYKSWYIDAHLAFGVTPSRAEFAGALMLP